MDALILSCGTGGGHNAAGRAIADELKARGHNVVMFNPYELHGQTLVRCVDGAYISVARRTPKLFGFIYCLGNLVRKLPGRSPVYFVNGKMDELLWDYLSQNHFDIVIMPHLFPAEILTHMKQKGKNVPVLMFIATDYVCTPFTEETDCDAYIIPSPELEADFAKQGIPKGKMHPLGIPSHSSFSADISREDAARRLGLDPQMQYILLSGGSFGAGKIQTTIRRLDKLLRKETSARLIVLCGSNEKLYNRLKKRRSVRIIPVTHTDQMSLYLKACSLYLTKPGGLSSTEAAACGVPLVHVSPIPGCETYNARFFSRRGMSLSCKPTRKDCRRMLTLLKDENACREMIRQQKKYVNAAAAADICDLAEQMCQP